MGRTRHGLRAVASREEIEGRLAAPTITIEAPPEVHPLGKLLDLRRIGRALQIEGIYPRTGTSWQPTTLRQIVNRHFLEVLVGIELSISFD
jgi:hypothetical protein